MSHKLPKPVLHDTQEPQLATKDKIHPRIKETAKRLWIIYFSLTALETVVLMFFGLSFFDAINHSLTTTSTGGFSTKQESIAAFQNPFVEAVIVIFMFLAGTNFTMIYFGLKMKFRKIVNNDEFLNKLTQFYLRNKKFPDLSMAQTLIARIDCYIYKLNNKYIITCNKSYEDYFKERLTDLINL